MVIRWSEPDDAFLVTLPEWDDQVFNPVAHGATYAQAAHSGRITLDLLIAGVLDGGGTLPEAQYEDTSDWPE